jgi:tRNA(fMet)-specific endonuclease VapC
MRAALRSPDERQRASREAFVEYLIASAPPLPLTLEVARKQAAIEADLERRGEVLGVQQLWIAATALSHGMAVASTDADEFALVEGLAVVAL